MVKQVLIFILMRKLMYRFFIDHGADIAIGATIVIGKNVCI